MHHEYDARLKQINVYIIFQGFLSLLQRVTEILSIIYYSKHSTLDLIFIEQNLILEPTMYG